MNNQPLNLRFSYNWNKKLDCNCFTTLRLHDAAKYQPGKVYNVYLEEKGKEQKYLGQAECITVLTLQKSDITEMQARLDTGYSAAETRKILDRMYKCEGKDIKLDLSLLKWSKKASPRTSE